MGTLDGRPEGLDWIERPGTARTIDFVFEDSQAGKTFELRITGQSAIVCTVSTVTVSADVTFPAAGEYGAVLVETTPNPDVELVPLRLVSTYDRRRRPLQAGDPFSVTVNTADAVTVQVSLLGEVDDAVSQAALDAEEAARVAGDEELADALELETTARAAADLLLDGRLDTLEALPASMATDTLWNAEGDLAVGTGPDAAGRLAKGTEGYGLVAGPATVGWERLTSIVAESHVTAGPFNTTVAEQTLASLTLPAGAVAAGDVVRLSVWVEMFNQSGSATTFQLKGKIGATTACDTSTAASLNSAATRLGGMVTLEIMVESTTAQRAMLNGTLARGSANTSANGGLIFGKYGTAAEDTSGAKTIALTCTMGASHASVECVAYAASLTILKKR